MAVEQKRIGELVRTRRQALGLTVEELAHKAQVSTSTVQRAENGRTDQMRKASREGLGRALEIDPDELRPHAPTPDLMSSLNGDGPQLQERLDEINEKLDEILKRLPPAEPEKPAEDGPLAPDDLPDAQDEDDSATGTEG